MDFNAVMQTLESVLVIVFGGLCLYLKTSKKAKTKASEIQSVIVEIVGNITLFITEAEEKYKNTTTKGSQKFEEVVDRLYSMIPDTLQGIISRTMIEDMVQQTFDKIEEYVSLQLDNAIDDEKMIEDGHQMDN